MAKLIIKEVAKEKGILQSHLQIKAAVTPPLLHRYWHNKPNAISLNDLERIAKALGVKSSDLIVDDSDFAKMQEEEESEPEPITQAA